MRNHYSSFYFRVRNWSDVSEVYSMHTLFVNAVISLICSYRQMMSSQSLMLAFHYDALKCQKIKVI